MLSEHQNAINQVILKSPSEQYQTKPQSYGYHNIHQVTETVNCENLQEHQQNVINSNDLSRHQTQEHGQAMQLLIEFSDVFSAHENDIGNVKDFQMKLNLKDDVPVQASYNAIPRNLYKELKHYIEDLLNKNWIRDSESSYSSPVVVVEKRTVPFDYV